GLRESEPQGELMGQRVKEEGESECRPVMGRIGVATSPCRESGQTSLWCRRAWTVSQPAQAVMQKCRRGRNDLSWCYSRHRSHLGSRLCRSNAQVVPKSNGATACLLKVRCPMLELLASNRCPSSS